MSFCTHCGTDVGEGVGSCPSCGKPPSIAAPPRRIGTKVVLVVVSAAGCLMVVAVVGIIAAIAIPNLLNAIDRGKQKRTMVDIRSLGTAVEAFGVDNEHYPPGLESPTPVSGGTDSNLESWLSPIYIRGVPAADGWGNPFLYQSDSLGTSYRLFSYGKDGIPSPRSWGKTQDFDCDIIYEAGGFVAWPEGIQT